MHTGWGRVAVGVRSGHGADPIFLRSYSALLVSGLRSGDCVLEPVAERPRHLAAESLLAAFLATACDTILFLDDDMVFGPHDLATLRDDPRTHAFAGVQALCRSRRPPHPPAAQLRDRFDAGRVGRAAHGELLEARALGLGFTLYRRRIIEQVLAAKPAAEPCFRWTDQYSEDIAFSHRVVACGGRLGVHTGVRVGHRIPCTLSTGGDGALELTTHGYDGAAARHWTARATPREAPDPTPAPARRSEGPASDAPRPQAPLPEAPTDTARSPSAPGYLAPYTAAVEREGASFDALLFLSPEAQARRFEVLAALVELGGRCVADLGCGRADLLAWLAGRGAPPRRYLGVEAVPGLAQHSRVQARAAALPPAVILERDFVADPNLFEELTREHGAEVLVFSGSLNLLEAQQAREVLERAWKAIEHRPGGVLAFNFLGQLEGGAARASLLPAGRFGTTRLVRWALERTPLVAFCQYYLGGHDATIVMVRPGA